MYELETTIAVNINFDNCQRVKGIGLGPNETFPGELQMNKIRAAKDIGFACTNLNAFICLKIEISRHT